MDKQEELADFWFQLRQAKKTAVNLPPHLQGLTLDGGYAAQDKLIAKLLAAQGGTKIGYKIGQ